MLYLGFLKRVVGTTDSHNCESKNAEKIVNRNPPSEKKTNYKTQQPNFPVNSTGTTILNMLHHETIDIQLILNQEHVY